MQFIRLCCVNFFQLESGLAEIFGTELAQNKIYSFTPGAKVAVFTFHGCTIAISFRAD